MGPVKFDVWAGPCYCVLDTAVLELSNWSYVCIQRINSMINSYTFIIGNCTDWSTIANATLSLSFCQMILSMALISRGHSVKRAEWEAHLSSAPSNVYE